MDAAAKADAGGYITEVPYVVRYHRELNPQAMRLALAMRGIAWGSDAGTYDYLELGCGFGLSLLFNAAGHPSGRFVGVDLNPEHIETARGIARWAEFDNVRFIEAAFADLAAHDLGTFDVIALHGVWSWINDANRRAILDVIDKHLRANGLLYVSYNTLPGLAATLPLRELMRGGYDAADGAVALKVDAGLKFAQVVEAAGAAYFTANPRAAQTLAQLLPKARNALAHEYFNADWEPFYHRDVAKALHGIGLTYAASAQLLDNMETMNYSPAGRALLAESADPETLKDFLANREFRRDLFLRGQRVHKNPETLLAPIAFASSSNPGNAKGIVGHTALGKISIKPELAIPVLTALTEAPASAQALRQHPACAGITEADIQETLLLLAGFVAADPALPPTGYTERQSRGLRLNTALWEAALTVDAIRAAFSPVTGSGIGLKRVEQLFLLARRRGENPESFLRNAFGADVHGDVAAHYAQFVERKLPILVRLGIT